METADAPAMVPHNLTRRPGLWVEPAADGGPGGWLGVSGDDGDALSVQFEDLDVALSLIASGYAAPATDARVEMAAVDEGSGRAAVVVRDDGSMVFRASPLPTGTLLADIRTTVAGLPGLTQEMGCE